MSGFIRKIRENIENMPNGYKINDLIRRTRIVRCLHMLNDGGVPQELRNRNRECYKAHKYELRKLNEILEDQYSKELLRQLLKYKCSGNLKYISKYIDYNQYFQSSILTNISEQEVFIDGGAYIGDTAREFIKFVHKKYKAIYLWEPDPNNQKRAKHNLSKYHDIFIKPYGLSNEEKTLNFTSGENGTSKISEDGDIAIKCQSIDNILIDAGVTFIKMDIEGAEIDALEGARKVITLQKPKLAICVYHEPEHLYKIPLMIKNMVPEYKIYLRHHSDSNSETVVYATL